MHLLEKARATGNSYRALLLIVVLQCWSASALASPHVGVRIDENTDGLDFHGSVMLFIDSLGIYGTPSGPGWPPASAYTKSFSPGKYKGGDIWCRFHLQNESSEDREFILEPGGFKEVYVFYRPEGSEGYSVKQTGNHVPYPRNEMGDRGFMTNRVKVSLAAGTGYEFLVWYPDPGFDKIEPSFVVSDAEKWETSWRSAREGSLIFFLPFLGICLILALINFVYYFIHRLNAYLHYVAYIIIGLLTTALLNGFQDFLFKEAIPFFYQIFLEVMIALLTITYYFFLQSFLDIRQRFPMLSKVLNGLCWFLLLGLIVRASMTVMELPIIAAKQVFLLFMIINLLVLIAVLIRIFRQRNKLDIIFISGTMVLVVEAVINALIGVLGGNEALVMFIFEAATVIELTIFSLGLGVKLRLNIQEKQAARLRLIDQLKENEGLQRSMQS
jgi:hypothetical protein